MSRLGELLVRENLISLQQLQKAQDAQKKNGGRLGVNLIKTGILSAEQLTNFLAKQYGVPAINLENFDPEISLDVVHGEHRELPAGDIAALTNSFGFGGHNVALTIRSI